MKKISLKEWVLWIFLALVFLGFWFKFSYPQFSVVDLTVSRNQAMLGAQEYLNSRGVDHRAYLKAIVFNVNNWADRYLQRTIGFDGERMFFKENNYELFSWQARFFRQFEKEEYIIELSPQTQEVMGFAHLVDDIAPALSTDKDTARRRAELFLSKAFGVDFKDYDFHEEKETRYERRMDYSFSWEKKGVAIPWGKDEGQAKLLIGATVSGEEISRFYKHDLDIPEKFYRYIDNQMVSGEYYFIFYFLMLVFLITASLFVAAQRRSNLIFHLTGKWFFSLFILIFLLNIISLFNNFQEVMISYVTSVSLFSFLVVYFAKEAISLIAFSIKIIPPGIAGESLGREVFKQNTYFGFTHYLKSTFFSRAVCRSIILGYLAFIFALGLQSVIFYFGQRYLGVWKEWHSLSLFSSTYIPFLAAFLVAVTAGFSEEILFRLFGLSWAKKHLKNTLLAVVFISLIWGFGHSLYAIFPVWFRGIEVSILGLLFGFVFLRYGLIAVIVTHYLFDAFWISAPYILGRANVYLFGGSLFILALPLVWAVISYFVNKPDRETVAEVFLSDVQKYNLNVLAAYILSKKNQGFTQGAIRTELLEHSWDIDLIDLALRKIFSE